MTSSNSTESENLPDASNVDMTRAFLDAASEDRDIAKYVFGGIGALFLFVVNYTGNLLDKPTILGCSERYWVAATMGMCTIAVAASLLNFHNMSARVNIAREFSFATASDDKKILRHAGERIRKHSERHLTKYGMNFALWSAGAAVFVAVCAFISVLC